MLTYSQAHHFCAFVRDMFKIMTEDAEIYCWVFLDYMHYIVRGCARAGWHWERVGLHRPLLCLVPCCLLYFLFSKATKAQSRCLIHVGVPNVMYYDHHACQAHLLVN